MTKAAVDSFCCAAHDGRLDTMLSILECYPELDINAKSCSGDTALMCASMRNNDNVVKFLLAHPDIDTNKSTLNGETALSLGCWNGATSIVKLLLLNPSVDAANQNKQGCTPLWDAVYSGHINTINWLIASDKHLGDVKNDKGSWMSTGSRTAIELATGLSRHEIAELLKRFVVRPKQIKHEIRVNLKFKNAMASELFSLVVFLCDDLVKEIDSGISDLCVSSRFFAITKRLPMELQMVVCNRAVGSAKDTILTKDSEPAFMTLAASLQDEQ